MAKPITHRRVLTIAVPIVISNATVPILGAVDTGVIGQMGEAAPIGAVGIGAIILTGLYWLFGFLRMGTAGLASQAIGARDSREVSALFFRATGLGFIAGVCFILLQLPLMAAAFWISPASDEVEGLARTYIAIRIYSAPAAIALYGLTGWLVAQERTGAILAIQLVMNLTNIALDILFVLGFGWGIGGVAFATFIAEWGGLALGLYLCRGAFSHRAWAMWDQIFDRARLINMTLVNVDILIRSALLQVAFVSFLFLGSDLGDVEVAANQVLLQFIYITSYAMDGFAFAAEALVGQAMGEKARARLHKSAKMTGLWAFGTCLFLAVAFHFGGPSLIALMAKDAQVQAAGNSYLIYMVWAPILGCAAWMLDGIFIGATRTKDMRNMMLISFIIYVTLVVVLPPILGNHGLWISLILFFVVRGITLGLRYPALLRAAD